MPSPEPAPDTESRDPDPVKTNSTPSPAPPEKGLRAFLRRRSVRIGLRVVIYVGLGLLLLRWLETRMTFLPAKEWSQSLSSIADSEEVFFESEDGLRLSGAWFPHSAAKGAIVFCHGNAGNLADRLHIANAWRRQLGYSVFLFDYRGYGKSEGSPSESGLLKDTRAAFAEAARLGSCTPILAGRSLGSVPAVLVARETAPLALILDSPIADAGKMARKILPIPGIEWLVSLELDNLSNIAHIACPILVLHGDRDNVVPFDHGKMVFDQANDPKRFVRLRGMGHNDLRTAGAPMRAVEDFVADL
ncbi:MAG: alpha/beta hydrolase [Planctomycetota bacterium]